MTEVSPPSGEGSPPGPGSGAGSDSGSGSGEVRKPRKVFLIVGIVLLRTPRSQLPDASSWDDNLPEPRHRF